jgi:hypothetical protein
MALHLSKTKRYAQLRTAIEAGRRDAANYGDYYGGLNLEQFLSSRSTHLITVYTAAFESALENRLAGLPESDVNALHASARYVKMSPHQRSQEKLRAIRAEIDKIAQSDERFKDLNTKVNSL